MKIFSKVSLNMKIPPSPLYQRGVKGGFSCFVVTAPGMGVVSKDH
jgi:hypothetical protein